MAVDPATDLACSLLRRFEAFRPEAYPDPATGGEPWTIGFGATGPGIAKGTFWTRERAEAELAASVRDLLTHVRALVKVPLPDPCAAALCSFAYNLGVHALEGSTLLRKLNLGLYVAAADQFPVWNRAAGRVFPGLIVRRAQERDVFLSGIPQGVA